MKSIFLILITLFTQSIMGQNNNNSNSEELNSNCLTNKSFDLVFDRIMLRPSRTILKYDNEEWYVSFSFRKKNREKSIMFRKNNSIIGEITSDLNISSVLKTFNAHEKSKKDINDIFCIIYDWAQGNNSIEIGW